MEILSLTRFRQWYASLFGEKQPVGKYVHKPVVSLIADNQGQA